MHTGNKMLCRILTLLESDLHTIMQREMHNDDRVHLYDVGVYWVAFEKSAYFLSRMTCTSDKPLVLYLKSHPFPVVMCTIHYSHLCSVCRNHVTAQRGFEYLQLLTQPSDVSSYRKWHREYVPVPDYRKNCIKQNRTHHESRINHLE